MLCIYYPASDIVNNGNISNEERMVLLTSYKECMIRNFKENTKAAAEKRKHFQDQLLNGLYYRSLGRCVNDEEHLTEASSHTVYDLCGFLLHARCALIKKLTENCSSCWASIATTKELLPSNFHESAFVALRDFGGLKYCTPSMSGVFKCVESILQAHFKSEQAYISDSFDTVIEKISSMEESVPEIFCKLHREFAAPRIIYEYVVIRFRFEAKRRKHALLDEKAARQAKRKLAKMCRSVPSDQATPDPSTSKPVKAKKRKAPISSNAVNPKKTKSCPPPKSVQSKKPRK